MELDLTNEEFKKITPLKRISCLSNITLDMVNDAIHDPELRGSFRDNFVSYLSVMKEGKFSIEQYINAVKYVSHKLLGNTNNRAYIKTFPKRYQAMVQKGTPAKDINSLITSYNQNKLVNLIYAQTLVPTYVINADKYQEAINVQADLMLHARSEKVRSDAANSLLTHLKRPEAQQVDINVSMQEDSSIADLRATTAELVKQQRQMLQAGEVSAKEIAKSKLIINSTDYVEVEE